MIKFNTSKWLRERDARMRPHNIDRQATSFGAFLDDIEWMEAYPENEHLAIKTIEILKKKWNILI